MIWRWFWIVLGSLYSGVVTLKNEIGDFEEARVRESFMGSPIAEYEWTLPEDTLIPSPGEVKGPAFYAGRPGFRLRFVLNVGQYTGLWLALEDGAFDEALEWPFQYEFNITLVPSDGSPTSVASVSCRIENRPGRCGEPFFPILRSEVSVVARVIVFLHRPPRAQASVRGQRLLAEYEWDAPGTASSSGPFYADGYLASLRISAEGDVFAVLLPGDWDSSLRWPFPHRFELRVGGRRGIVDPKAGRCPAAAFARPRRDRPNAPCGFRRFAGKHPVKVQFSALLEQAPRTARLSVREEHLVAEYRWQVPSIERKMQLAKLERLSHILSERFYVREQSYLMQLQLKFSNGHVGLFLTLLEGDHDDLLEWPFKKRFRLSFIDQRPEGAREFEVALVDPSSEDLCADSFWRPFGRNDACGAADAFSYEQLYEGKFIRYGALLLKVEVYLEEILPPRFASLLMQDGNLLARFEWRVTGLAEEKREYLDSDKFYLSPGSYRMMLRLYPEKTPGHVGLYAVLSKGAYDDHLDWPFPLPFKLEVADSQNVLVSRNAAGCPEAAFRRPERELADWSCGEGRLVPKRVLAQEVRFAVQVTLQKIPLPAVASPTLRSGTMAVAYFWAVRWPNDGSDSPLFYTSNQGYAMRLTLSITGRAVSLHWTLHKGQHDDVLEWPFRAPVLLALVSRRLGDLERAPDPCPREAFERPLRHYNSQSCGFSLPFDKVVAYVGEDGLLRIRTTVIMNTDF